MDLDRAALPMILSYLATLIATFVVYIDDPYVGTYLLRHVLPPAGLCILCVSSGKRKSVSWTALIGMVVLSAPFVYISGLEWPFSWQRVAYFIGTPVLLGIIGWIVAQITVNYSSKKVT